MVKSPERRRPLELVWESSYKAHATMMRALELCRAYPIEATRNDYEADLMKCSAQLEATTQRIQRVISTTPSPTLSAQIVAQFNQLERDITQIIDRYEQLRRT